MAATLPAITLECSGCGHSWPSRARAGSSIRCPRCRRGHRVPAARPLTAAQARAVAVAAADDSDELAAAWDAEQPYQPDWRKIPGAESGHACSCGGPTRWTGAHTGLACPACRTWGISPGAKSRAAEHLAATARSGTRKSATAAERTAERAAAEALASVRADLLDDLDGLAELLDVDGFPRAEPFTAARREGIRGAAITELYKEQARSAATIEQLARVADDAGQFAAGIVGWLDRIAELRAELGLDDDGMLTGEVLEDDPPGGGPGYLSRAPARRPAATGTRTGLGTSCKWCAVTGRQIGGRYPEAVARIEAPGMPPGMAPADVCADHLAAARQQYGATLRVHDQFWALYDTAAARQALDRARATTTPRRA